MKSFFSKIGTLLLCGVAVAMVSCNDLQEDINKTQDDIAKVTVTVEDLQKALAALEAEQDKMAEDYAKKADVEAAKTALEAKLAEEKAALADALEAVNNALAGTASKDDVAALEAVITELQAKAAALEAILGEKADKAEVEASFAALAEQYEALLAALEGKADQADVDLIAADVESLIMGYQQTVEALLNLMYQVEALAEIVGDNSDDIESLKTFASEATFAITNLQGSIDAITERVSVLEQQVEALMEGYQQTIATLQNLTTAIETNNATDEDQAAAIVALQEAYALLSNELTNFEYAYQIQVAEFEAQIDAIHDAISQQTEGIQNIKGELDAKLAELEATLDAYNTKFQAAIDELTEMLGYKVDKAEFEAAIAYFEVELSNIAGATAALLQRVQSLVYVPEFSDHKATLNYAVVNDQSTILNKASDFKYLVKAEDAAKVAAAIAANPSCLEYIVETVETRTTEEVKPALEIVKVTSQGEYVIVSAVAKNFAIDFFNCKEEGIYSAALVLNSQYGVRTSEFANLVAGEPEEFTFAMVLPAEEDELAPEENGYVIADDEILYKMPCNDTNLKKTAVKPVAAFIPANTQQSAPLSFFTEADLKEKGYDVTVETAIRIIDTEEITDHDGTLETKPGYVTIDKFFNIESGNPVGDFTYSVKNAVPFTNVGKESIVRYIYTCGNAQDVLEYKFVLSNAQVYITIEKNVNWTFDYVQKYIETTDPKTTYVFAGIADADTVVIKGIESILDLESVLEQTSVCDPQYFVKGANGWETGKKAINIRRYTNGEAYFQLLKNAYSFNNSYKTVYTTTAANVDYNTSVIVNLVGYQPTITVPVTVDFKLDAKNPAFVAPVDLEKAAYTALTNQYDFLGYGQNNAASWNSIFRAYQNSYNSSEQAYPTVNGTSVANYKVLEGLTTARLFYDMLAKEGANEIAWSIVNPVKGFTINYVITGNVIKPNGQLLYADSYVTNETAVALGQLATNEDDVLEYSIVKSHLPYYFNVDQIQLVKDGDANVPAHNYTVKFTVVAPNASEAMGDVKLESDNLVGTTKKQAEVDVLARDGSYYPLEDDATLDWNTYRNLEVNVTAELYANGYLLDTKVLKVITNDPLTFTVANVEVDREMRKDIKVQLFKNAVLTSIVEKDKKNLIDFGTDAVLNGADAAFKYAETTYGAKVDFVKDPAGVVYYYDHQGKKVYLPKTQYSFADGILTVKGDDSVAKTYYADFTAKMTSRICAGEHVQSFRVILNGTK